jgi:hypothetical protein
MYCYSVLKGVQVIMNNQQITHTEKLIIRQSKSSFKIGIFSVLIAIVIFSLMTFFQMILLTYGFIYFSVYS